MRFGSSAYGRFKEGLIRVSIALKPRRFEFSEIHYPEIDDYRRDPHLFRVDSFEREGLWDLLPVWGFGGLFYIIAGQ